jgi:hypothetical protein
MKKIFFVCFILMSSCVSTKQQFISCTDVNCPYCHGTGKRGTCNNCQGKGIVPCVNCNENTEVCSECNGSGEKLCGTYAK